MATSKRGFTLIELMIVISIISLVAAFGLATNYRAAQKTARDGKRKSDLEQIRSALEMYYADKGYYPYTGFGWNNGGNGWATNRDNGNSCYNKDLEDVLEEEGYISPFPRDPKGGCNAGGYGGYMYYHTGKTIYCLYARLEIPPSSTPTCKRPLPGYNMNYCACSP